MEINDLKKDELMEVKRYLEITKKSYSERLENYSDKIQNNFGLPIEEVDKLDTFFSKSYVVVLKELIEHYKTSIDGKRKGNPFDFNINTPVVTSSKSLSSNQCEYLIMKYYQVFAELSLHDLGIDSIKILEKYWPSDRLSDEIKYDENNYGFTYVLSVSCSIKKLFFAKQKILSFEKNKV